MTTAAMAVSMLPLFVIGALGPVLVVELGLAPARLGVLVAVGFGAAAVLSLPAGRIVDRVGWDRCLVALFGVEAAALALFALAPNGWWLVAAVLLGAGPAALANPVTNKAIRAAVPEPARGSVTGWKQSGVQLGALVAGVPLAASTAVVSWRVGLAALAALVLAGVALGRCRLLTELPRPGPVPGPDPAGAAVRPGRRALVLGVFSVALGAGLATVNTYVALYAAVDLAFPPAAAGALVATVGAAGLAGRIGWSRAAGRAEDPMSVLPWLALAAAASVGSLLLAPVAGRGWAWLAAFGVGAFGVAANAVSMVAVIRGSPAAVAGRASAVVAAGFFTGFTVGPAVAGSLLRDGDGAYVPVWVLAALALVAAAAIAGLGARLTPVRP